MADEIQFTIEKDGTISIKTDEVSPINHKSADEFLAEMRDVMGGKVIEKKLPHKHGHGHSHVKVGR